MHTKCVFIWFLQFVGSDRIVLIFLQGKQSRYLVLSSSSSLPQGSRRISNNVRISAKRFNLMNVPSRRHNGRKFRLNILHAHFISSRVFNFEIFMQWKSCANVQRCPLFVIVANVIPFNILFYFFSSSSSLTNELICGVKTEDAHRIVEVTRTTMRTES